MINTPPNPRGLHLHFYSLNALCWRDCSCAPVTASYVAIDHACEICTLKAAAQRQDNACCCSAPVLTGWPLRAFTWLLETWLGRLLIMPILLRCNAG